MSGHITTSSAPESATSPAGNSPASGPAMEYAASEHTPAEDENDFADGAAPDDEERDEGSPERKGAKRPARTIPRARKKAKLKSIGGKPITSYEALDAPTSINIDGVQMEITARTRNLSVWSKIKDELKIVKPVEYTPHLEDLETGFNVRHIRDMPVYDNRNYVVVQVQPKKCWRYWSQPRTSRVLRKRGKLTKLLMENGKELNVWVISVRDLNDPAGEVFELYDHDNDTTKDNYEWRGGLLEESICKAKHDAETIGNEACKIMNCLPCPILKSNWYPAADEAPCSRDTQIGDIALCKFYGKGFRLWIEIMALQAWDSSFDFAKIHVRFLPQTFRRPIKLSPQFRNTQDKTGTQFTHFIPAMQLNLTDLSLFEKPQLGANEVKFSDLTLDPAAVHKAANEVPSEFYFVIDKTTTSGKDFPNSGMYTFINYTMFGLVGFRDRDGLRKYIRALLDQFRKRDKGQIETLSGFRVSADGLNQLVRAGSLYLEPRDALHRCVTPKLPRILVATRSRTLIAYIRQQGLNAFAAGKGLVNAWQAMMVAADQVRMGNITVNDALTILESCLDNVDRSCIECYCLYCNKGYLLCDMFWDPQGRLLCRPCFDALSSGQDAGDQHPQRPKQPSTSKYNYKYIPSLLTRVKQSAMKSLYRECILADTSLEAFPSLQKDLYTALERSVTDAAKDVWTDGFNGQRISAAASFAAVVVDSLPDGGQRLKNPMQASVDAAFPVFMIRGNSHIHVAENTVLTAMCLNYAKGSHIPAVLPWIAAGVQHFVAEVNGEEAPHDNNSFWKSYRRATDNAYMIRSLVSFGVKARVRNAAPFHVSQDDFDESLLLQFRTGVWRPNEIRLKQEIWKPRPHLHWRKSTQMLQRQASDRWSREQQQELRVIVKEIEDSPIWNPRQLIIPRHPTTGAPWLWRKDLMYENHSFDYLFDEFEARLRTWDEECDKNNETKESPATLFVEAVRQWFRNGGKCHLLGCIMVNVAGHLAVFSFGRAVARYDIQGNEIGDVLPGSLMQTGCINLRPTSMGTDYDVKRCSVIVESWTANRMRSNFLGGATLITHLKQTLIGLAQRTRWYDAPLNFNDYAQVDPPKVYTAPAPPPAGVSNAEAAVQDQDEAAGQHELDGDDDEPMIPNDDDEFTTSATGDTDLITGEAPKPKAGVTRKEDIVSSCYCGGDGSREQDETVVCGNPECSKKTFHLGCTELTQQPSGDETWICTACEPSSISLLESANEALNEFRREYIDFVEEIQDKFPHSMSKEFTVLRLADMRKAAVVVNREMFNDSKVQIWEFAENFNSLQDAGAVLDAGSGTRGTCFCGSPDVHSPQSMYECNDPTHAERSSAVKMHYWCMAGGADMEAAPEDPNSMTCIRCKREQLKKASNKEDHQDAAPGPPPADIGIDKKLAEMRDLVKRLDQAHTQHQKNMDEAAQAAAAHEKRMAEEKEIQAMHQKRMQEIKQALRVELTTLNTSEREVDKQIAELSQQKTAIVNRRAEIETVLQG